METIAIKKPPGEKPGGNCMRNQLTNPGEPIRDVYIYWMDKNCLQNRIQLLYQRYGRITDMLIVKNELAGS